MTVPVGIVRIFEGILFIISGVIKLNDPVGFSYKLQEYFSPGVLDIPFLVPIALFLAVFLVVFELILGVMLIIGYKPKFTVWSLLLMILFFTFLTFYSAYFNKVTDCGCFGDAMPLTPWESFSKDVVLLIMIILLFVKRKYIQPLIPKWTLKWVIFVVFIGCLWFAYHVLMHLPAIDFRAYKEGVNIQEGMTVPEDAQEAIYNYAWTFDVNGKEVTKNTTGSYPNVDGTFLGVETTLLEEGYIAPIHDFSLEKNDEDYTDEILNEDKVLMVVAYNLSKSEAAGLRAITNTVKNAQAKGYRVIGLSASGEGDVQKLKSTYNFNFDFYFCDETAIKTIVRSNPGLVTLKKGTIQQKLHWNDAEDLNL